MCSCNATYRAPGRVDAAALQRLVKWKTGDLNKLASELAGRDGDEYVADATLKRIFAPRKALLATAIDEDLLSANISASMRIPTRRDALRRFELGDVDDDPEPGKARALPRAQVVTLLEAVDTRGSRVGRVPRVPPHLRVATHRGGSEHRSGVALPRAPLTELHPRRLRAPHG
jgi:hypothetical protein